jgi:hypothetical protein
MAAEKTAPPGTAAEGVQPGTAAEGEGAHHWGGLLLDIAGIFAGVVVAFVVIDIWTGGRLSARFRKAAPETEDSTDAGSTD